MTFAERSSFCVDINILALQDMLSRFASFFVEPYLEFTSRETAIESGTYLEINQSRVNQLQRHLTSKDHPYHNFRHDNWLTAKEDLEIGNLLKDFFESHYSANLMTLAICGSGNLDDLISIAEKTFSGIKDLELKGSIFSGTLCTNEYLKILVKAASTDSSKAMRIQWPIECGALKQAETDAVMYLLHVFNYKAKGSLLYLLEKDLKWTVSGCCAQEIDSFFTIDLKLTALGVEHFKEICVLVFRYISMLKGAKAKKYIFEELQRNIRARFESAKPMSSIELVEKIASNMLMFPPSRCLIGLYPSVYSEPAVRHVQNTLSPERVRIFLLSDDFDGPTNALEPVNQIPYSIEAANLKDWGSGAPETNMFLPKKDATVHNEDWGSGAPETNMFLPKKAATVHNENSCVCIIYHKAMMDHVAPKKDRKLSSHPERPSRLTAIMDRLEEEGLLEKCAVYDSEEADLSQILQVHESSYVRRIIKGNISNDSDMYFSKKGSEVAIFLAAGGAIKACDLVATGKHQYAFAVVRPPGHHASSDSESGFCYFNNIAIAAKHLLKEHKMNKILILDWDVHFGDGTSKIFYEDKDVLFISLHRTHYPEVEEASAMFIGGGDGLGYNVNVCLAEGVNDDDFFAALDYVVMPLAQAFDPDAILISAGFDAAAGDKLGACFVTHAGYATMLNKLLQLKKRTVLVLEGGYFKEALASCCVSCIKVLNGDLSMIKDTTEYTPLDATWESISEIKQLLKQYHPILSNDIPPYILSRTRKSHTDPKEDPKEVT